MKIKAISHDNCRHEFHQIGCAHDKGFGGSHTYEIDVDANNMKELCHQLELNINADFAADYGMSVAEYVAAGEGYRVSKSADAIFRVFPCIKFQPQK